MADTEPRLPCPGCDPKWWHLPADDRPAHVLGCPTRRQQRLQPRPTMACRFGRHDWEQFEDEARRCADCLKTQIMGGGTKGRLNGKWYTRRRYNEAWCPSCGNELVSDPFTDCVPVEGGASRVRYYCRCMETCVFDYGLAPVAILVEADE